MLSMNKKTTSSLQKMHDFDRNTYVKKSISENKHVGTDLGID